MKKSNIMLKTGLVVVLAVILIALSVSAPTFSWFARPGSETGGSLSLSVPYGDSDPDGNTLSMKGYDGAKVTMKTYKSNDDGISFSTTAAEPAKSGTLGTSSTSNPINRIYYRTEIVNGSTTPQNVSLYIKNFEPGAGTGVNVCVGVNVPIKAFKNYSLYGKVIPSATKNKVSGTTKRVYFNAVGKVPSGNAYDSHRTTWANKTYYVRSGSNVDGGSYTQTTMQATSTSGVYYADISSGHNQLYICCNSNPQDYQRTQTFTDLNGDGLSMANSLLFYTNGGYTDYNNAWAGKESVKGASFASYYNSVSITMGQTINVALNSSEYSGTLTYSSSNNSVFTVAANGEITPKGSGTAYLYYDVKSQYNETKRVTATVKVQALSGTSDKFKNAPIVTNLLIPAAKNEGQMNEDKSNVQDVYWFIQNGDPTYGEATSNATYKLDGIYLGL